MAVTIKDIAREAGVSRGTVDRVLHNRTGVKPEVAIKVREIAERLGFFPNKAGKALAALKQPMTFGCLLPSIGNPFFDDLIDGLRMAERELSDFGVSVDIMQVKSFDTEVHVRTINALKEKNYTALCITSVDVPEVKQAIEATIAKGIPVVCVNTDIPDSGRLCYIGPDYYHGGKTAAGLLSMICKEKASLLILTGSFHIHGHNERIKGFLEGLEERKLPFEVIQTQESLDDNEHAYAITLEILEKNPQINCIYVVAAGVEGACRAVIALNKESSVKVVTFDDIPTTKMLVKQKIISFTLCQEPIQQGYRAIQKLFSYMMGNQRTPLSDSITNTIIKIRENIED
ncbi:LacI family DNA-binding transcriptional regulator [uncultured Sphaerochaeta sp.]|uniref:LacI family DNA-binding transcriptional regulator n=1 Tax=uncultured Sphaerochaeta sp. TaxID=886478 RepID=UPI002A0A556E|nr:LacI family DNA-binding transcriptional regulator [uncultured Sphaerochaeta sp.]